MATDYDLRLVVDADTSAAEKKLDALGASGKSQSLTPSAEAQDAAERVRQARGMGGRQSGGAKIAGAGEFGREAGNVAGKAIGKAVAGFMATQVATLVFSAMKTPGGDNRNVNMAEAGVGGALRYGTMGAMLGGPVGAAIGAIGGAVAGLAAEARRQQQAVQARDQAIRVNDYSRGRDQAVQASDRAFGQLLDMAGGWKQRVEMLRARRDELVSGAGQWSLKNLEKLVAEANPESDVGKVRLANLEMQKQRVAALDQQIIQEGITVNYGENALK